MVRPPLRAVESEEPPAGTPRPGGGGNGGSSHGERLARIEAKMEYMATREDVSEVKVLIERKESTMTRWLLGILATAVISLVAAVIGMVVALVRIFLTPGAS